MVRYLRLSVTDRCNLNCAYCAADGHTTGASRREVLAFEEIVTVVSAAAGLGIEKLRITGGEPLLRRGIGDLLRVLSANPAIEDLSITTNGVLLEDRLADILSSRIGRVNVSLDTLDGDEYLRLMGAPVLDRVVRGIDAALSAGLRLKLNCVYRPGLDRDGAMALAGFARGRGAGLRFIEPMYVAGTAPVGISRIGEFRESLVSSLDLVPAGREGVARMFVTRGGDWRLGFIVPSEASFCQGCDKLRLSATGLLRTCLFATGGVDLRAALRGGEMSRRSCGA